MAAISIEDQIACVKREIGMRRNVYPRWQALGKMTKERGDREIAQMEAVQKTLEALKEEQDAKTRLL